MAFSSGRAQTRRFTSAPAQKNGEDDSADQPHPPQFVPNLFDLVYVTSKAAKFDLDLPPVYLEAASVDSSKLLGRGASFTASLGRVYEGSKRTTTTTTVSWGTVTTDRPADPRPRYLVYKTARVKFDKNGEPVTGHAHALQSVLTELHALTYPSLCDHPNIITFLGLAWGTSEYDSQQYLPALVVEYADQGTLADVLASGRVVSAVKQALCFDVANGLQAIHNAKLVHGDIKAENVLICTGESRQVAKLADFGFSIAEEVESGEMLMGGTWPWTAPEVDKPLPVSQLRSTDIYSLGLMIWLIAIDGGNPFSVILGSHEKGAIGDSTDRIDHLKQSGRILAASSVRSWFPAFVTGKLNQPTPSLELTTDERMISSLQNHQNSTRARVEITKWCTWKIKEDVFLSKLDTVFASCLTRNPEKRDLRKVVDALRENVVPAERHVSRRAKNQGPTYVVTNTTDTTRYFRHSTITSGSAGVVSPSTSQNHAAPRKVEPNETIQRIQQSASDATQETPASTSSSWGRRGHKHHWLSWQAIRDLAPGLQSQVSNVVVEAEPGQSFVRSALHINGYGCSVDCEAGLAELRKSAAGGSRLAKGYLYRLHIACKSGVLDQDSLVKHLDDMARLGSRAALEDLTAAGLSEKAAGAGCFISNHTGGVGAVWYYDSQMLHGLTVSSWHDTEFVMAQARNVDDINTYRVNTRGDTILHMLSAWGEHRSRKLLVDELNPDINCLNHAGDTPLLAASRAGQGGSMIVLLQQYKADASIAAQNGETPLHWLIRFEDDYIEPITKDLIARGANVNAATTEYVSHSIFPGTIDCDFQVQGTPLGWAVHHDRPKIVKVLLRHGADPTFDGGQGWLTPMQWAAHYHHTECLRVMIEHLERKHAKIQEEKRARGEEVSDARSAVVYNALLYNAVHAADRFSMMLRHGPKYLERMASTLDLLRERTAMIGFGKQFGSSDQTLFYLAVTGAHDDVVAYMIQSGWRMEDLNEPCGAAKRNPVLEAVRWNRKPMVELLVQSGADITAKAISPFKQGVLDWSALHILAHERFHETTDLSLLSYLVKDLGLPIDGYKLAERDKAYETLTHDLKSLTVCESAIVRPTVFEAETPFSCALRNNTFSLCSELLSLGADVNALSFSAGLYTAMHALTILGHVIVSNARYSGPRLEYLLALYSDTSSNADGDPDSQPQDRSEQLASFVVEPTRSLTALHLLAMGPAQVRSNDGELVSRGDFDWAVNAEILQTLLRHFRSPDHLNARTKDTAGGETALHLAVRYGNVNAVRELVAVGADREVLSALGRTSLQYCGDDVVDSLVDDEAREEIRRLLLQ